MLPGKKNRLSNHSFFELPLVCIACLLLVASGCSRSYHQNLSVYRMLNASLVNATTAVSIQNIEIIKATDSYNGDTLSRKNRIHWLPKMNVIHQRSMIMTGYIDSLKVMLKIGAGLELENGKEIYEEGNYKAVSTLFGLEGKGKELKERMLNFKRELSSIDPVMNALAAEAFFKIVKLEDVTEKPAKTFEETFFQSVPAVGVITVLSKFQNDITLLENKLLIFCRGQMELAGEG